MWILVRHYRGLDVGCMPDLLLCTGIHHLRVRFYLSAGRCIPEDLRVCKCGIKPSFRYCHDACISLACDYAEFGDFVAKRSNVDMDEVKTLPLENVELFDILITWGAGGCHSFRGRGIIIHAWVR